MFDIIRARIKQKHRTMKYPFGPAPELPERFRGMPVIASENCGGCGDCAEVCPTSAVSLERKSVVRIDMGKCLFCGECERVCEPKAIRFGKEYRLAAARRHDLIVGPDTKDIPSALNETASKIYSRSLKLRQVSAGGCNACEADSNVLTTVGWDMGRFGISFVASPRHADCLLVTGPVTTNMKLALEKTYKATSGPRLVVAVGACAISGGTFSGHREQNDGVASVLPVDLFIPGCPPHPLVILDGLLRFIGRIP